MTRLASSAPEKPGVRAATWSSSHAGGEADLLDVHGEDLDAPVLVRSVDEHLAVETPGAQQRRIENLGAVGGGEQHQPRSTDRSRRARRAAGSASAPSRRDRPISRGAARAAERVELVDEDDRRRPLARLLEQIAHARRAHADEHLDELRAGDGEERHPGLAGDRAREQRLAGARRADQQHALGNARAEPAVAPRVLEELDDLLQFGLRLVDAGDVGEGHPGLLLDVHLGAALADVHEAAEPLLAGHAADEQEPDAEEHQRRHHPGQEVPQEGALVHPRKGHVVLRQALGQIGLDQVRHRHRLAAFGRLQLAGDAPLADRHLGDAAVLQHLLELAVGHHVDRLRLLPPLLHQQHAEQGDDEVPKIELVALLHVRASSGRGSGSRRSTQREVQHQVAGDRGERRAEQDADALVDRQLRDELLLEGEAADEQAHGEADAGDDGGAVERRPAGARGQAREPGGDERHGDEHHAELLAEEQAGRDAQRDRVREVAELHAVERDPGIGKREQRQHAEGDRAVQVGLQPTRGRRFARSGRAQRDRQGEQHARQRRVHAGFQHRDPTAPDRPAGRGRGA